MLGQPANSPAAQQPASLIRATPPSARGQAGPWLARLGHHVVKGCERTGAHGAGDPGGDQAIGSAGVAWGKENCNYGRRGRHVGQGWRESLPILACLVRRCRHWDNGRMGWSAAEQHLFSTKCLVLYSYVRRISDGSGRNSELVGTRTKSRQHTYHYAQSRGHADTKLAAGSETNWRAAQQTILRIDSVIAKGRRRVEAQEGKAALEPPETEHGGKLRRDPISLSVAVPMELRGYGSRP